MRLREFFDDSALAFRLQAETKDDVLAAIVGLLGLDERSTATLLRLLHRRENLGSTGVGRGIAIPHCRSLAVQRLRLAYVGLAAPVEFQAADQRPVQHVFLIVAPPIEVSNQYLPVLGRIAQFARDPDATSRLSQVGTPDAFYALLEEKQV